MKKSVNPKSVNISRRFFQALELAISRGKIANLKSFCQDHDLNRVKYATMKTQINLELENMRYKTIDLDALAAICTDFEVSAEWLLLGRGKMLKNEKNDEN
jgi:hypothetical protein